MSFDGCLNSQNILFDFNLESYLINVWIKVDKIVETCDTNKLLRYYFVAYPHVIYSQTPYVFPLSNLDTNYFYFNVITNIRTKINDMTNFNWNLLSFSYNSSLKEFKLIINNNIKSPAVFLENTTSSQFTFKKLIFCANNSKCTNNSSASILPDDFIWGSAFYKDLTIYDGVISNFNTFIEKEYNLKR